jgi:hypothetical protein
MKTGEQAEELTPAQKLDELATEALENAKKAKKAKASLKGHNFYGDKMAGIRSNAHNAFKLLTRGVADAELDPLVQRAFDLDTESKVRADAIRDLRHYLHTKVKPETIVNEADGLFPIEILKQANRGYLVTIGKQMNGNYSAGWYDGALVMMRRLVEISIIEAFEGQQIAAKIKDGSGEYLMLTELVAKTLAETSWKLSRTAGKALPRLKDLGHASAHGRYFLAREKDVEDIRGDCRVVIEEMLHHAKLL